MEDIWSTFTALVSRSQLIELLGKTLLSLLVLTAFLIMGRVLRGAVKRISSRTSSNANLPILLSNLVYVALITIAALTILSIYTGAGLSTLLTLLGLVSLAISLSVQDVLKNFVSGIYLLLEQPFSIGERVKVREIEGVVENIEIRTTRIKTDDGVLVFIPNSIVFSEVVTNRTAYRQQLQTIWFKLPAHTLSFGEAQSQIKAVMAAFEPALVSSDPEAQVLVEAVSLTHTDAKIEFWSPVTAPASTRTSVMLELVKHLPDLEVRGIPVVIPPVAPVGPLPLKSAGN